MTSFVFLVAVSITGCRTWDDPSAATIVTPSVKIEAAETVEEEDRYFRYGYFCWKSNEVFDPVAFGRGHAGDRPTTSNYEDFCSAFSATYTHLIDVLVTVGDVKLFGKLAMYRIADDAQGPIRRGYQIEIPQQYVAAATEGKVSVVYESYRYGEGTGTAWVLWLCDRAF